MSISSQKYPIINYSPEEIKTLLKFAKTVKFSADEIIVSQGEMLTGIYIITKGSCITHVKLMGEGIAEIDTYSEGNFLGEISFIENIPSPKSIVSKSETQCIFISKSLFEYLSLYDPMLKYHLLNSITIQICDHINQMYEKISSFITNSAMTQKLTFIGKMMKSFNSPEKISLNDMAISTDDLHQLVPFKSFNNTEFEMLLKQSILLSVPKNSRLISPDKKLRSIFIVIFGAVQSTIEIDNKVAKLSVIEPGKLFVSPLLLDPASKANIAFTSCEKAIVMHLTNENIDYIKNNEPVLWHKLFDLICHSLAALEKSVYKLDVRLNIETYNR